MKAYYRKVRPEDPAFAPTKREEDADYDLYVSSPVVIQPGETCGVHTNIAIEFPANFEGKVEDKSGLALKRSLHVLGGVIDNGYTGEIIVIIHNLGQRPTSFKTGEKVAQMKLRERTIHFTFQEVDRPLRGSERGDQGFGSQGV